MTATEKQLDPGGHKIRLKLLHVVKLHRRKETNSVILKGEVRQEEVGGREERGARREGGRREEGGGRREEGRGRSSRREEMEKNRTYKEYSTDH